MEKTYVNTSPTLVNCLLGAISITKNADIDKNKFSGYGIGFDRGTIYSVDNGFGRNVIIFGVDMSSYEHIDNKKKDILVLGKGPSQGLEHEKCIQLILQKIMKNIVSACITVEQILTYLLMVQKFINLRQKILRLLQRHYV